MVNIKGRFKMSNSIEKIKAYHSMKSFLTEVEQKELADKLGLTEVDLSIRLVGKDNEIQFIMMLYLLGTCKNMIAFEEGVSTLTKTYTPDLFVEFNDGRKVLIEIKSTDKETYKITKGNFDKKVKFAEEFGYPLYFAIKLKGYWMLFHSDYLESRGRKININNYKYSVLNEVTGNRQFLFPKGLKFESYYSLTATNELHISHPKYGNLVQYSISYKGQLILSYNRDKPKNLHLVISAEALQDAASNDSQKIYPVNEKLTKIEECLTEDLTVIDLHLFVLAHIKHLVNDLGINEDINSYFRKVVSNELNKWDVNAYFYLLYYLQKKGVEIYEITKQREIIEAKFYTVAKA